MNPLSPATREVFELFPPQGYHWFDGGRLGFWMDTAAIIDAGGKRRGYSQLNALERRGLIQRRSFAPWRWEGTACVADWGNSEHFVRLTHAGVIHRNRLDGRRWAFEVEP